MTTLCTPSLQDLLPQMVSRLFPQTTVDDLVYCRKAGGDVLALLAETNDLTRSEVSDILGAFLIQECARHLSQAA